MFDTAADKPAVEVCSVPTFRSLAAVRNIPPSVIIKMRLCIAAGRE